MQLGHLLDTVGSPQMEAQGTLPCHPDRDCSQERTLRAASEATLTFCTRKPGRTPEKAWRVGQCTEEATQTLISWGAWVARSVKHPTLAQVMISQFVGSSPTLGSVLTLRAWNLLQIMCPPLSAPSPLMLCLSLSLNHALSLSVSQK